MCSVYFLYYVHFLIIIIMFNNQKLMFLFGVVSAWNYVYSILAKQTERRRKKSNKQTNNKRVGHRVPSLENWGGGLKIFCNCGMPTTCSVLLSDVPVLVYTCMCVIAWISLHYYYNTSSPNSLISIYITADSNMQGN